MKLFACTVLLAGMLLLVPLGSATIMPAPRASIVCVFEDDFRLRKMRRRKHYSPY